MTYTPRLQRRNNNVQISVFGHSIRPDHVLIASGIAGLIVGLILALWIVRAAKVESNQPAQPGIFNRAQEDWKKEMYAKKYNEAVMKHLIENQAEKEATPEATPTPEVQPVRKAKVSAYSCGGLKTSAEIKMNCPSLLSGGPKTATGTTPRPYITVACDRANVGRKFHIEGIGQVVCEDTGGAIKGAGRFDLYVTDVHEARKWGVQELAYQLIEE